MIRFSFDLINPKLGWETKFGSATEPEVINDYSICPEGRYRHETGSYFDFLILIGGGEQMKVFDINSIYFFDTINSNWIKIIVKGVYHHHHRRLMVPLLALNQPLMML